MMRTFEIGVGYTLIIIITLRRLWCQIPQKSLDFSQLNSVHFQSKVFQCYICLKHPPWPGLAGHIDSLADQLTTASSFSCRAGFAVVAHAELSWAELLLYSPATYITLSYLALEMPFRQKLLNNLAAFYSLNRKVFKCNHWQMLPRQLRRNLDSFQLLVVVFDLPVGCQHLSTKKTLLRWNQPSHLFSFSQKDFWRNRPRKSHTQRYWLTKKSKPEQLTPCWNSISSAITSQDSKPLCNISHGETADQIFPKKLSYFFSHKI